MSQAQLDEDRKLARRVAAGDTAAFEAFFREYFPRLYRFTLTRVGGDESLAEEVVQRTMCIVVRKMSGYRGEALLFTWLCRICRNEMTAARRAQGFEVTTERPLEDEPAVQAALESMSADVGDPTVTRGREELKRYVRVTLEYLPARYAAALEMKYLKGLSVEEIAEALDLSGKAAESVLSRARAAFREGFRALHDLEPDLLFE